MRGKRAAWAVAGTCFAVLSLFAVLLRHDIRAWIVGYELFRLDEGVTAFAVNGSGVAAVVREPPDASGEWPSRREAGRWSARDAGFVRLEVEGIRWTVAQAVNEGGDILGYALDENGFTSSPGLLWVDGGARVVRIEDPAGRSPMPLDLNSRREVVGQTHEDTPFGGIGGAAGLKATVARAFLWTESSGLVDLHEKLDAEQSGAVAINERGWIAGWVMRVGGVRMPFVWRDGSLSELVDEFARGGSVARDINDAGTALVNSLDRHRAPLLWFGGDEIRPLPIPEGCDRAYGTAIDARGRVLIGAGASGEPDERYFLYDDGELTPLPRIDDGKTTYWNLGPRGWLAGATREETAGGFTQRGFLMRLAR